MKLATNILTVLSITLSTTAFATTPDLVATDSTRSTQICMAATEGSRVALHRAIEQSGMSKKFIVESVKCNKQNITDFVATHSENPEKVTSMLNNSNRVGRVSISDIASL